jgi:hypothetical protein
MHKAWCAVAVAALALWAGELRSGEDAARALVQKAVEAQGGADKLAKFNAASIKGKGTFYGQADEGVPDLAGVHPSADGDRVHRVDRVRRQPVPDG